MDKHKPIDVVIAWVDGSDPALAEKRVSFLKGRDAKNASSGAHTSRFASVNEIRYCVLSILKFAPFVRNIFILTDGQDPKLYRDIEKYFPDRAKDLKVVDHTMVFEGYESALPSFNSISIEHMMWRIKGLSDNFVYFNDDMFLLRPLAPTDWFRVGVPVLQGKWHPAPWPRLAWEALQRWVNRSLLGKKAFQTRASFHMGQWNSAFLLGFRLRYFSAEHAGYTISRPSLEAFWSKNEDVLKRNIAFRFRDHSQFTAASLSNHLELKKGNRQILQAGLVYMQPYQRGEGYIASRLRECEENESIKHLCVQDLDRCSEAEQKRVLSWLEDRL